MGPARAGCGRCCQAKGGSLPLSLADLMAEPHDPIDRAIGYLSLRRRIRVGERHVELALLLRSEDWRPLKADWWRGKEVSVIGADLHGNFFLRHCDGSVRYWDHAEGDDTVVAASVREFVSRIEE
jgi:hypothetical protein